MDTQQEQIKEEWRPVVGYDGLYEVSNFGNVKSLNYHCTGKSKNLKLILTKDGYFNVMLVKDKKKKIMRVHRLVAMAFIPNPDNLPIINHKDETRDNNRVENLEWCTNKYNLNYGTYRKRMSELNEKYPVLQYTLDGVFVRRHTSTAAAAKYVHGLLSNILNVCTGKRNSAYGYKWEFEDEFRKSQSDLYRINRKNRTHEIRRVSGTSLKVLQYSSDGILLSEYPSIVMASERTGISKYKIRRSCRSNIKEGDFIFKIKEI